MFPMLATLPRLLDAFFVTYPLQHSLSVERESLLNLALIKIVVILSAELHHAKLKLSCVAFC